MIPKHELYQMYYDEGMTKIKIAELVNVSLSTICNWMKKYGIETRAHSESHSNGIYMPSKKELYDMYWMQEMSQYDIAKNVGVSQFAICNWMKGYGIETRTCSESHLIESRKPSEEELYDMYWAQGMSLSETAKEVGVSQQTIGDWMKSYRIETRVHSDIIGEKSGGWKGGISFEPYCDKFNNKFKEAVRERDDYTCQLCRFEQNGEKLSVHHIHYDKENCYPDVVALCRSCNSRVNSNRDYWEEYFENQLLGRGLYCWSIGS